MLVGACMVACVEYVCLHVYVEYVWEKKCSSNCGSCQEGAIHRSLTNR